MPSWDELSARMDAAVDDRLGDTVEVSADAGASWVITKAFVNFEAAGLSLDLIDEPMASLPRMKIAKSVVPAITKQHRFRSPKFPGVVFRAGGEEPQDQGRYVIFDLQKV